ncbi:hypothetical protein MB46_01365 [Arthrobacter alpinus]|nr:hypothetical protein MB46_01365 [Arthrobacter alpinus]
METAPNTPPSRSVYSTPTRILAVVAVVICGALSVNLVLTGTPSSIWEFLPWLLFVAWGIYVLLWRPCLLIRTDGVFIRNILRDHEIPFSALKAMRVIQNVSFDTTAGRIPSWGAPGAGKLGPKLSAGSGGLPLLPPTQAAVQSAWDAWERRTESMPLRGHSPESTVTSSWNLPSGVVGVLLLVLSIASALT